jgi:hypothetical protein
MAEEIKNKIKDSYQPAIEPEEEEQQTEAWAP